jgi:hypothetical protein
MLSDIIPISPLKTAFPDPSAILPFQIITSYTSGVEHPENINNSGRSAFKSLMAG